MNKTVYVCGHYNIDLLKQNEHSHRATKLFIDMMNSSGVFPLITKPSGITDYSNSLIDNIFTNCLFKKHSAGLIVNDITDHLPIFVISNFYMYVERNSNKKNGREFH